jgi:hypothetical protein
MSASLALLVLVPLNGPDGQIIWVNPEQVVSVRGPRGGRGVHFGPGVECLVEMSDGKFVNVTNPCDAVIERTKGHGDDPQSR